MPIQQVFIRNFRNIKSQEWSLVPGLNVLEGENAQGKTNFLEALYYLANGKSFRIQEASHLICFETEAADLGLQWDHEGLTYRLECRILTEGKDLKFQGKEISRWSPVQALLRILVFTPESSLFFRGSPGMRRRYLDHAIAVHRPGYATLLGRYQRVLRQRNQLLEQRAQPELRASFDEQWANLTLTLMQERGLYLEELRGPWRERIAALTGEDWELEVQWGGPLYEGKEPTLDQIYQSMDEIRDREWRAGRTLLGPQRDDLQTALRNRAVREVASQGQQRLLVIALKLAEADIFQARTGRPPVFLLDDLGSELDVLHRGRLLDILGKLQAQTVLTTAQSGAYASLEAKTFRVNQGRLVE